MKHFVYAIPKIKKVGATQNPKNRIETEQGFKNWKKYIIGEFHSAADADIFEKKMQWDLYKYKDDDFYPDMLGPIVIKHLGKATCTLKDVHFDDVDAALDARKVVIMGKNYEAMEFTTLADLRWLKIYKQRGFKSGNKEAYWRLETMQNYIKSRKKAKKVDIKGRVYIDAAAAGAKVLKKLVGNARVPKKVHITDAYTAIGASLLSPSSIHDEFQHPKDYSFEAIRVWCQEKKLYGHKNSSINTQNLKLVEEVGELAKGILKDNPDEIKDAIGDIIVVLTSISELNGHSIETAIQHAWKQIRVRKGSTNAKGDFLKKPKGPKY